MTSDRLPSDRNDRTPKNALGWHNDNFDAFFGVFGSPLSAIPDYQETWKRIYAGEKQPPKVWAICAGSWFWSRSRPLLSDEHLLAAIPKFLQGWPCFFFLREAKLGSSAAPAAPGAHKP